jgi:hypothetical protein
MAADVVGLALHHSGRRYAAGGPIARTKNTVASSMESPHPAATIIGFVLGVQLRGLSAQTQPL